MKIFSDHRCILGEGPLWHPQRQSLFWVDINAKQVFEKRWDSPATDFDHCWTLPHKPSALACMTDNPDEIWVVSSAGLGRLCTISGQLRDEVVLELAKGVRSNDAGIGPDARLWIGTMEEQPSGLQGAVYRISPQRQIDQPLRGIGIPNTFCWSPRGDRFYLSDSLRQQMTCYPINDAGELAEGALYIDLSTTLATPDGGATDSEGNLWNAQWDGARIACYHPDGTEVAELPLPLPRPTSCCFGGPDNNLLFISSASEGLSAAALSQAPWSGKVLCIELAGTTGLPTPSFALTQD